MVPTTSVSGLIGVALLGIFSVLLTPFYKPGTRVCSTEASKEATLATPEVFIEAAMPSSACPEKEHQM